MSKVGPEGRSYLPVVNSDLQRLAEIACVGRTAFFRDHPEWGMYAQQVVCVALCQGAALHMIDGATGINDFDVYTFYAAQPTKRWYSKRIKSFDFGDAKYGQSLDRPEYIGRRVDCLGREIDVGGGEDPVSALLRYLRRRKTKTARLLAEKAVVLLEPQCGLVVWPDDAVPKLENRAIVDEG